jgi:hypothetical protein
MLYNRNGMATWCWEAAHALQELGRSVLLIAAPDTPLPDIPSVEIVRLDRDAATARPLRPVFKAAATAMAYLEAASDGVLQQIHASLANRGIQPRAYILNQSTLVDRAVCCPQLVAAWSYPIGLPGYLRKIPLLAPDKSSKSLLRTTLSAAGWWRKDWRAYRSADRVLAVTNALSMSLRRRSVSADLAYPGTSVGPAPLHREGGLRLLMAAVRLNEPRKRILWMLDAMKRWNPPAGTVLQLAGIADDAVRRSASQLDFPVQFLGHLQRNELQQAMQHSHILCFGSILDDWGYVLVEAMANGLVPVAPAVNPFSEILGDVGCSYSPQSQEDFIRALDKVLTGPFAAGGREAWDRARKLFSREAFGRFLVSSVDSLLRAQGADERDALRRTSG